MDSRYVDLENSEERATLKLLGVVTFVTTFAVSDHHSFKVKYKVETVLVQVVNSSIRCPPHQA